MQTQTEEQLKSKHLSPLALMVARATPWPHGLSGRVWPGLPPPPVLAQKHLFRQKRGGLIQIPKQRSH